MITNALSGEDLSDTIKMLEGMLAGKKVKKTKRKNPKRKNPLIDAIMLSMEDNSLPGYSRGQLLTETKLRSLPVGTVVWIHYCKDDNPDDVRFNGAYKIESIDSSEFTTSSESWEYNGNTSRGQAHYYKAKR